jgi:hypothetical protein
MYQLSERSSVLFLFRFFHFFIRAFNIVKLRFSSSQTKILKVVPQLLLLLSFGNPAFVNKASVHSHHFPNPSTNR